MVYKQVYAPVWKIPPFSVFWFLLCNGLTTGEKVQEPGLLLWFYILYVTGQELSMIVFIISI